VIEQLEQKSRGGEQQSEPDTRSHYCGPGLDGLLHVSRCGSAPL
jgi:hypothetical protein